MRYEVFLLSSLLGAVALPSTIAAGAFEADCRPWLQLTDTAGLSYDEVVAQLYPDGWRHATIDEVCDLIWPRQSSYTCPGSWPDSFYESTEAQTQLEIFGILEETYQDFGPDGYLRTQTSFAILDDGNRDDGFGAGRVRFRDDNGVAAPHKYSEWDVAANARGPDFVSDPKVGHWLTKEVGVPIRDPEPVIIDAVSVGDPGNLMDPLTGHGAVAETFAIGRTEVTNAQYAEFLEAVAATDPHQLYYFTMEGSITRGEHCDSGYTYDVVPGRGDIPVTIVSFLDAMRFANWLHNGQPVGPQGPSTTEDGAYTLTNVLSHDVKVTRNPGGQGLHPG